VNVRGISMKTPIDLMMGGLSGPTPTAAIWAEFCRFNLDEMPYTALRTVWTNLEPGALSQLGLGTASREHRDEHHNAALFIGPECASHINHSYGDRATIYTCSAEIGIAEAECERIANLMPKTVLDDATIETSIWRMSAGGPKSNSRSITTTPWVDVERNYAPKVASALRELMKSSAPVDERSGRIILWYGPPGTGKTSALRTLGREWREWCDLHIVSDPEVLMQSPDYLFSLADTKEKWRLIVAEDSDAFLHSSSGGSAAMGRLLNFTDGFLGQGSKVLFLLTTNEPVAKLHPAVTRPGRCMAQIEFSPFDVAEAAEWLGRGHKAPPGARTLAELYEDLRDGRKKITQETECAPVGQYL